MTPDGLPILGSDPSNPSLVYACGYSRNGILFAPWAGKALARAILGEPVPSELELFSVGRFAI
jgi:glycine/D-amino acid oxidase-like deaminating enzyme